MFPVYERVKTYVFFRDGVIAFECRVVFLAFTQTGDLQRPLLQLSWVPASWKTKHKGHSVTAITPPSVQSRAEASSQVTKVLTKAQAPPAQDNGVEVLVVALGWQANGGDAATHDQVFSQHQ